MSALGQADIPKHSLDHFVGAAKQCGREGEAEGLSSSGVEVHLKSRPSLRVLL
jgi:hypothetical protein